MSDLLVHFDPEKQLILACYASPCKQTTNTLVVIVSPAYNQHHYKECMSIVLQAGENVARSKMYWRITVSSVSVCVCVTVTGHSYITLFQANLGVHYLR